MVGEVVYGEVLAVQAHVGEQVQLVSRHKQTLYTTCTYCTEQVKLLSHLFQYQTIDLSCTVLYCTVLHCTVLNCTILYYTVMYCSVLYCTVMYCTVLRYFRCIIQLSKVFWDTHFHSNINIFFLFYLVSKFI